MAGTAQIPPGGTWFDTHKKSFADVPIDPKDQGISTNEFLEAAESTTTLFGEKSFDISGGMTPLTLLRYPRLCGFHSGQE
jgi:hypothetical protein